jgi:hypothetical protein
VAVVEGVHGVPRVAGEEHPRAGEERRVQDHPAQPRGACRQLQPISKGPQNLKCNGDFNK